MSLARSHSALLMSPSRFPAAAVFSAAMRSRELFSACWCSALDIFFPDSACSSSHRFVISASLVVRIVASALDEGTLSLRFKFSLQKGGVSGRFRAYQYMKYL